MLNNEIYIKNLEIGDKVVGMHVDILTRSINIVAGKIKKILNGLYYVDGIILYRPHTKQINFSGVLKENEIEIIDNVICNKIMELYELANKQLICESLRDYHNTINKINEIRHNSRLDLQPNKSNL